MSSRTPEQVYADIRTAWSGDQRPGGSDPGWPERAAVHAERVAALWSELQEAAAGSPEWVRVSVSLAADGRADHAKWMRAHADNAAPDRRST